jgi:small glutamine-rich tetratricopeptide repeat-containing protein alpha
MSDQKKLLLSIFSYLRSLEQSSSIDSAVTLIESTLDAQNTPTNFSNASYYPLSLQEIFAAGVAALSAETPADALASVEGNTKFESFVNVVSKKGFFEGAEVGSVEYLQRQAKLVKKFKERQINDVVSVAEAEKLAEEKKGLGNSAIVAKDYMGALAYYTEALEISADGPNSHIYHCNRAAAHCHLNNYIEAVEDCNASLALQPTYVKAFSRLGLANYFLER